jgi:uncharacterized iron-regulated membrane protein
MIRRTLFWCHLLLGLAAALPVLAMSISGLLLVFQPQILAFAEGGARNVSVPTSGKPLHLDAVVLQAAGPLEPNVSALAIAADPAVALELRAGRDLTLWADPFTGASTGQSGSVPAFMKQIETLHRWLGNRGIGGLVTGVSVLFCLVLSLTGLVLWWPRSLKAMANVVLPKRGLTGRARDWQWHNAVGFLVLPLFVVLSLTGTIMSWKWAETALYVSVGSEPPRPSAPPKTTGRNPSAPAKPESATGREGAALDRSAPRTWQVWFDTVVAHAPVGWDRIVLQAPEGSKGASATVLLPGQGRRQASSILLAPDGTFKEFKPGRSDAGTRLRDLVRPLHTGELFGVVGQILVASATLGVLVLVWTGMALSWRRFRRWRGMNPNQPLPSP